MLKSICAQIKPSFFIFVLIWFQEKEATKDRSHACEVLDGNTSTTGKVISTDLKVH